MDVKLLPSLILQSKKIQGKIYPEKKSKYIKEKIQSRAWNNF